MSHPTPVGAGAGRNVAHPSCHFRKINLAQRGSQLPYRLRRYASRQIALCLMARSARCGSRREATYFVVARRGRSASARFSSARRREHRESAAFVLTRRRKACLHTRPPISGARSGPLIDGVGLRGTACLWQAVPKRSTRTDLMASVLAGAERREAARRDERDLFSP